eukprot:1161398-Pelagomonas_calceolata.AAC.6
MSHIGVALFGGKAKLWQHRAYCICTVRSAPLECSTTQETACLTCTPRASRPALMRVMVASRASESWRWATCVAHLALGGASILQTCQCAESNPGDANNSDPRASQCTALTY